MKPTIVARGEIAYIASLMSERTGLTVPAAVIRDAISDLILRLDEDGRVTPASRLALEVHLRTKIRTGNLVTSGDLPYDARCRKATA